MNCMKVDLIADTDFGAIALRKFGAVPDNFRLFYAGWYKGEVMTVSGAEFRVAKSGKNKGKMSIKIPGTTRRCYVTKGELSEV